MKRILEVIASMNPKSGGICEVIRNNAVVLKARGVALEVVCFDEPDAEFLKRDNFPIYALGKPYRVYAYHPHLQKWLKENLERYDMVTIHGLWLYNSYGTFRAWKKYKKTHAVYPALRVAPHGMLDPYFQKAKDRKLKALRNYFFWKLIESKVVNGADEVLFTSEQEMLLARQAFTPYKPKKERIIRYGILQPPAYTDAMRTAFEGICPAVKNQNFILFLSRIHSKKGVDLLIKAYLKLKKENRKMPKLVIAGPGMDSAYGKELEQLIGGDETILFSGMLTGNVKWGAFYGCACFILPSHQENFGIAVAEALACKKPVLISKQVNIWREIDRENGGIFDDDTEDGVYRMLRQWLMMNEEQKKEMGERAFSSYNKYFNLAENNNYC